MTKDCPHHLLFVYGTMKRGFRNHSRILRNGGTFLRAITSPAIYTMRTKIAGEGYLAPILFAGGTDRVQGELYSIPAWGFEEIDMAEGHPDIYRRVRRLFGDLSLFVYQNARTVLPRNLPVMTDGVIQAAPGEVVFHNISD